MFFRCCASFFPHFHSVMFFLRWRVVSTSSLCYCVFTSTFVCRDGVNDHTCMVGVRIIFLTWWRSRSSSNRYSTCSWKPSQAWASHATSDAAAAATAGVVWDSCAVFSQRKASAERCCVMYSQRIGRGCCGISDQPLHGWMVTSSCIHHPNKHVLCG